VRYVIAILVFYVLGLNACVRSYGGDAHLLSLKRMPEKTHAVLKLGLHAVTHVWSDHCERERAAELVAEAARARGIPVRFALAIARTESGFRSHSISSTGAMGLMQLMPQTARSFGVTDPFDPADNARGSLAFIHTLWQRYSGDRRRVAAAYNAGPARVARRGKLNIPAETRGYTQRVAKYEREPEALPRLPFEVARR
jgi:soluble lytic murein transglycosylase-like protein